MTDRRYVGVDYGDRHLGIAVADAETALAFSRPAIEVTTDEEAIRAIMRLIQDERATVVVIGLPLTMRGETGPQARKTESFVAELRKTAPCPIEVVDERLTTAGSLHQSPQGNDHSGAARLILETWLAQHP